MEMLAKYLSIFVLLSLFFCACSPDTNVEHNSPAAVIGTAKPSKTVEGSLTMANSAREEPEESSKANVPDLVLANNQFGLSLMNTYFESHSPGNFVLSPYSIALGLAQAYGGAANETAVQMRKVLNIEMADGEYHQSWNWLDQQISKQTGNETTKDKDLVLSIANSTWVQKGYPYQQNFLNLLVSNYGSDLRQTDFAQNPQQARLDINQWVTHQTENKIEELVPEGAIDPLTNMALVNAIYLKAAWQIPFVPEATTEQPFYRLDGITEPVATMYQSNFIKYQSNSEFILAEISYNSGQLSFVILMPVDDSLQDFLKQLNAEQLNEILAQSKKGEIDLWIPKFEIESAIQLNDNLKRLGMVAAFDSQHADFSGMDADKHLFIGQVLHQAFIDVDEAGTEAAAATAILMQRKSMMLLEKPKLRFDHPFLFLVRDQVSAAILFQGVYFGAG